MSVTLTVNGTGYSYPETGDQNWGGAATAWAQAVTAGMLQKAGGSFILTAEIDFGANFGLKALYYKSRDTTVASSGHIRMANNNTAGDINWRNAANGADLKLYVDASDDLIFDQNGTPLNISAASSGNVTGPGSSTDEAIARFDLTTGQLIQNSVATLSDTGLLTTASLNLSGLTASRAIATDGSKNLVSSAVTDTELGYLSGVTSAIQTQLGTKVTGPASATDNALARFDLTTGKLVQDSGVTIDDSNNIVIPGTVTINGAGTHSVSEQFANEVFGKYARPTTSNGTDPGSRGVVRSAIISATTTSSSFSQPTNGAVTLTTNGRPIIICLVPETTLGSGYLEFRLSSSTSFSSNDYAAYRIKRDTTVISDMPMALWSFSHSITESNHVRVPSSVIHILDFPSAGTYTFSIEFAVVGGPDTIAGISNSRLVAYEL